MSMADVTSARSSPVPDTCPECDATASVTSDLHKYQVACTCKPGSVQYACADDPGPPPPAKTDTPPALPPRPPTTVLPTGRRNNAAVNCNGQENNCRRRKYAWWCVGCGALAAALGGLLAAQHILVRAYTASPHHLETVPAAVPAAMLVLTGVCIMSLARRRNRYSYMIKVVGACCLICALTCVLVTITTTVIHMNKLQTLKFCDYTKLTRTCTCFSMPPDSQHTSSDDDGVRCVFEGVSGCGVVHGALYWCLRGVFALSVTAVLVCIFSCMLAYQLLSHERKKMYWEQLELRCRSLYRPPTQAQPPGRQVQSSCNCCTQCHPSQPAWDISLQHRFWAPGRIGNLYSPNPGTGRKTSAWSWFPWPRSNSQNSRCRMGIPQSGDSAYGFCENDAPTQNPQPSYEERTYPGNFTQTLRPTGNMGNFAQGNLGNMGNFAQGNLGNFAQGSFAQGNFGQEYSEQYGEGSGSFDATTGVWGPPPPYSPQGRSGSRHHLHHQDPATATLLHHHHIDVHRNSMHEHPNIQTHTCNRNSYLMHNVTQSERNDMGRNPDLARLNPDLARMNPELVRINPDLARMNPELARMNPELARLQSDPRINSELTRLNPEIARLNPDMARLQPEIARLNPDLARLQSDPRLNSDLARINPELARLNPDLARLNPDMVRMSQEMGHMYPEEVEMQEARFNTLRGHLVPYTCQRIGMSASNLHCRDENVIECLHQKSASKVSDQSSDSCQKQGKENLGFQNDKHSPLRASMQDCRGVNQNAESEVYFADVSSCCNVSVKAECCNPNVSALVGTIENHPESTSESEGSFTLTRQQRPQPQVGSKRRQKHKPIEMRQEKHLKQDLRQEKRTLSQINSLNSSLRLTEHQIEQLNLRMNESRMNDSRDRLSELNEIDRLSERMNETRLSERGCERMERMNDVRVSERLNESRLDRLNESRLNDSRVSDRMNETRLSERGCERMERMNDVRVSERMNDSRISERINDSRISDRMNDSRISERMNDSRMNDSRISDRNERHCNDSRMRMNDSMNESRDRMSELNSSIRLEGSPRTHMSPIRPRTSPIAHPRQSSSDSNKAEFFVPPPPVISPLSPNTEESLLSDDDRSPVQYSNDPESSKRLGPDSQYESQRDENKEILKANHHHCYSDTNTMDSGWQSGSEKQVTD